MHQHAQAALKSLQRAMLKDDEPETKFLAAVIEEHRLWDSYETDDGKPYDSFADFAADADRQWGD